MMKGTSASVLSSLILSSCFGYFEDEGYNTKDSVYGEFAPNLTRGEYVIEINTSNLSQEFINHTVDVPSLIEEITTDKAAAISFRTAPITVDNEVITLSLAQIESQSKIGKKYVRANLEGYYGLRKL